MHCLCVGIDRSKIFTEDIRNRPGFSPTPRGRSIDNSGQLINRKSLGANRQPDFSTGALIVAPTCSGPDHAMKKEVVLWPGLGAFAGLHGGGSLPVEIDDVTGRLWEIGEPAHLFGWSYGTLIATETPAQVCRFARIAYEPVSRPFR